MSWGDIALTLGVWTVFAVVVCVAWSLAMRPKLDPSRRALLALRRVYEERER